MASCFRHKRQKNRPRVFFRHQRQKNRPRVFAPRLLKGGVCMAEKEWKALCKFEGEKTLEEVLQELILIKLEND